MYTCKYCTKTFSTSGTLSTHTKRAKYCLKLRDQIGIFFECHSCSKTFTTKQRLVDHKECCIKYQTRQLKDQLELQTNKHLINIQDIKTDLKTSYEKQITDLKTSYEKQITDLQDQLSKCISQITDIALAGVEKPTTNIIKSNNTTSNTNNLNLNVSTLTPEKANKVFTTLYNAKTLLGGPKELAHFVNEHLLGNNEYVTTDTSRNVSKYKENGVVKKDLNNKYVIGVIHTPAKDAAFREYTNIVNENSEDENVLDVFNTRVDMALKSYLETKHLNESGTFSKELSSITVP